MKTVQLKSTKETLPSGQEIEITTEQLIKTACNNSPQGGFTATDMMDRIKILDLLDKAEQGKLELEDADHKKLGEFVKATKWAFISRFITEFDAQFR